MKVRLFTDVATAQGSWATGIRDLPDSLASELIAARLACKPEDAVELEKEQRGAPRKGKGK